MTSFPPLYKYVDGKVLLWRISVEHHGSVAVIVREHGYDGQIQSSRTTITEGKNLGRSNETTPLTQAISEAQSEWNKQVERKGYGLDPSGLESAAKRAMQPMLAHDYYKYKHKVNWNSAYVQPKLDGIRCLARRSGDKILLISRESKSINTMDHIVESLHRLLPEDVVFDGELYSHELPFQTVVSAVKRFQPISEQICFHVYDLAVPGLPYSERYRRLTDYLSVGDRYIKNVETFEVVDEDELLRLQSTFVSEGYEGAMLRDGSAEYASGKRTRFLLKVKKFKDAEFEILDVRQGRGTCEGMAIFVCRNPNGGTFNCLSPGTHDEKRDAWERRSEYIGKQLTVKFFDWTDTNPPSPRFPIALRIREDV